MVLTGGSGAVSEKGQRSAFFLHIELVYHLCSRRAQSWAHKVGGDKDRSCVQWRGMRISAGGFLNERGIGK